MTVYLITVVSLSGVDKSGECNMTVSNFTVDETPPRQGQITTGPYYDQVGSKHWNRCKIWYKLGQTFNIHRVISELAFVWDLNWSVGSCYDYTVVHNLIFDLTWGVV